MTDTPAAPTTEAACPICGHDVDHTTACPAGCPKCASPRNRFIDNLMIGAPLTARDLEYLNHTLDAIVEAEARSTPAEALHSVEISETMDAMPTHDNGCRCWPHVSRRDAERAIEAVALAEYRSRSAEALDVERLAATEWAYDTMPESFDVIRDPVEAWNDRFCPATSHDKGRYRRRAAAILRRLSHNEEADHE